MSYSSTFEENIEEDITEDVYGNDDGIHEDVDIRGDIAESLTDSQDSAHDAGVTTELQGVKTKLEKVKTHMDVIEQFSGALAHIVVAEAMLINEIHELDKLNTTNEPRMDNPGFSAGEVITSVKDGCTSDNSGYDPYLMQKLLGSKADPDEATIAENIDENLTNGERDRCIKEDIDRDSIDINDKNNNQVSDAEAENDVPGVDNALETIHEDTELQLESNPEVRHSTPDVTGKQQEAGAEHEKEAEETHQNEEETEKEKSIKFSEYVDEQEALATERTNGQTLTCGKTSSFFSSDDETDDEEPDCCEMTYREKKAVVLAVRDGDIDLVEVLLEKRNAHIDMLWYGENLLMVAIRMLQQKMAEFLIDNDINLEYESRIVEKGPKGDITIHTRTARQMAFDRGLDDSVELIDYKTNNLFPFITPKQREIRMRRPRPPTPPTPEPESDDDFSNDPEDEDGQTEHGARRKKSTRDNDSGINHKGEDKGTEKSMSTYSDEESVHSSTAKQKSLSNKTQSHSGSRDDLSQVFGPDEGYETMSPISPVGAPNFKFHHNVVGTKEYVSIRGTKSSHLLRAHTASKRTVSYDVSNNNEHVGSYGFERRKWKYCKSAPAPKNTSVESIPDSVVRYGLPFIHGSDRNVSRSADTNKRTQPSRTNRRPSAYDEVIKVLSTSRLLNPGSKSMFPTLPGKSTVFRENHPRNLNINYIYANRGSANSTKSVPTLHSTSFARQNSDLLQKRKLKI